jgi:hypothetical protein
MAKASKPIPSRTIITLRDWRKIVAAYLEWISDPAATEADLMRCHRWFLDGCLKFYDQQQAKGK